MSLYNYTMRGLVETLLPPPHAGQSETVDLLASLLEPQSEINAELDVTAENQETRARWNGQFIVMRAAIENLTGIAGISVINVDLVYEGYFYLEAEPEGANYFGLKSEGSGTFLQTSGESISTVNFQIGVPVADYTAAVEDQIRAEVNIFALANRSYEIITT
jgi:hypothetical protein